MRRTAPAIAALGLGLTLTLTGCFANPLEGLVEGIVEGGVEQIIEDQTGVDIDIDGNGASLPDSWPADVPTPQGEVLFAASADGTFAAAFTVSDLAAGEALYTELVNAGFTQTSEINLGEGGASRSFENDAYLVSVIVGENEDGTAIVQYTIVPNQQ